jgi:hypothetical protein
MSDSHSPAEKWDCLLRILPSLTAYAAKLFLQERISAREDILPATGKSPRGLAFDVVTDFVEDGMKFRQRSSETYEKDLFNYLKTAVYHDFLDLIKSHEYQSTDVIDAAKSGSGEETPYVLEEIGEVGSEHEFYSLESAMLARRLLPIVDDDPDLKEVLEAILCFGVTKREDIADILEIAPQEVTFRKNRLRVRLASWHRKVHASRKAESIHG